jgi:hypothetical protein
MRLVALRRGSASTHFHKSLGVPLDKLPTAVGVGLCKLRVQVELC